MIFHSLVELPLATREVLPNVAAVFPYPPAIDRCEAHTNITAHGIVGNLNLGSHRTVASSEVKHLCVKLLVIPHPQWGCGVSIVVFQRAQVSQNTLLKLCLIEVTNNDALKIVRSELHIERAMQIVKMNHLGIIGRGQQKA